MDIKSKKCINCILDESIPGIKFDNNGVCSLCKLHEKLDKDFPININGNELNELIEKIKYKGINKKYNCVVGVSGGTDSSYTLYMAKKLGLRPLAVHFDNGWNTELSVSNIYNLLKKLNVDLQTYVVDWEEFKDIQLSFLKASVPDAEQPTDLGIVSVLYRVASKNKIKYILNGVSFRTEGNIPAGWGYVDGKYIKSVHKKFGVKKLKTYPNFTLWDSFKFIILKRIKLVRFLNYIDYNKNEAGVLLKNEVGWRYPGGHHHESIYTRFYQGYLSPKKYGMDRRLISLSAQIRSGHISRREAINIINSPHYSDEEIIEDKKFIAKKFNLYEKEMDKILSLPNKSFKDYKTYFPLLKRMKKVIKLLSKLKILPIIYHDEKYS